MAVAAHLDREFRSKDLDLRCLLLVGAYQLLYLRTPDHAAINETVNACRALRKPWAKGLVNAVLRRIAAAPAPVEQSFGLPGWMAERLGDAYPDEAHALMAATLERAPMSIRINRARVHPDVYAATLADAGIPSHPGWWPEHRILETPIPARELPGYETGQVSIQDAGAQLVAPLVAERCPRGRILDACAAPGGKLFHLAELAPDARITGLERSASRLAHLHRERARLGHEAVSLLEGDATGEDWHDGVPFDAILIDAPCSGTGTLRRHPDIKLLRRAEDLADYAALQFSLLTSLWRLLGSDGVLVYCTCSLFPEENDEVIERFLTATPDARIEPVTAPTGKAMRHGWQLLPLAAAGIPDTSVDGFYFARMTRGNKAR